ncbi:hypothetical protein [Leucobacter japonicus]|uniref:hypothetical protein n=1 Tax=Leucobacter japonicus TaxID=1461259 RepID=UPI0006A7C4F7|nr:hypothetical protein [Leucobacter japonicus]
MGRSRQTAKQAGSLFESHVAAYLAEALDDDRIERRAKNGSKDRGDIGSVRTIDGQRVVIECKDVRSMNLSGWVDEAEVERGNDDAAVGVVAHKRLRYGPKNMGGTYVTMTLKDFSVLLGGTARDIGEEA